MEKNSMILLIGALIFFAALVLLGALAVKDMNKYWKDMYGDE